MSGQTYGFQDLRTVVASLSDPTLKRGLAKINIRKPVGQRKHVWDKKTFDYIVRSFTCHLNCYLPERQDASSGMSEASIAGSGTSFQRSTKTTLGKRTRTSYATLRRELNGNGRGAGA